MTVMIMEWWWWLYIMILPSIAKNMKQNHPYLSQHINITWTVSGVPTKPQQRTQGAACPVWKRLPWNSSQWMTSGNQPFVFQWWAPSNREGIKCLPKLTKLISCNETRKIFIIFYACSLCQPTAAKNHSNPAEPMRLSIQISAKSGIEVATRNKKITCNPQPSSPAPWVP